MVTMGDLTRTAARVRQKGLELEAAEVRRGVISVTRAYRQWCDAKGLDPGNVLSIRVYRQNPGVCVFPLTNPDDYLRCTSCGEISHEGSWRETCVLPACNGPPDMAEPAEYELVCPECGAQNEHEGLDPCDECGDWPCTCTDDSDAAPD